MAKNAAVVDCKLEAPEFREFTLELVKRPDFDLQALLPIPDIPTPDFDLGFEMPELKLPTKPEPPSLPSPAAQLKALKDGLQFTIDLKKQVNMPDVPFEPPAVPPVPTLDNAADLALSSELDDAAISDLGIDLPSLQKFKDAGIEINLPDLVPPNYKYVCVECVRSANDANFEEGDVTIKISSDGGEILKERTMRQDDRHIPLLLKDSVTKIVVDMTGNVKDSQENVLQKTVSVEIDV